MARSADSPESLQPYPNIRAAAEILGVSASTLSRRQDLVSERRGERDLVLAPAEVLRLAAVYRKRSLNDVAQDLLEHAGASGPDEQRRVEEEIEAFFEANTISSQRQELLRLARRMLPPELREQVEASLDREARDLPDMIQGYPPLPEP
jgi:hypothetical protein